MREDRARLADPGEPFERHRDMRMGRMRIAAQRVDHEQVDALEEVDHAIGKLRKIRSEEHTSELQSLMRISYAVFCLKKKTKTELTENNTKYTKNNTNKHID